MRKWSQLVATSLGGVVAVGCLGLGEFQEPETPPIQNLNLRSVNTGAFHSCGLADNGMVYCWGFNGAGQLGDGTVADKAVPVSIEAGSVMFDHVSAGGFHSCAVTIIGEAACWGDNSLGQLGIGFSSGPASTPIFVETSLTFVRTTLGNAHSCGLAEDGRGYCWGSEEFGQLGNGLSGAGQFRTTPDLVVGDLTFRSLSAGATHTCGVTTDNLGYCWGSGPLGQLGDGTSNSSASPVMVAGDLLFKEISAGGQHTCGVTTDLEVYCWGDGTLGQLGTGDRSSTNVPVKIPFPLVDLGEDVIVSAGGSHTCGILGDATQCWGLNDGGQIGDGTRTDRDAPADVSGGLIFADITAGTAPLGAASTCGITVDDLVYCWGAGSSGQIGNGGTTNQLTPAKVSGQN